MPRLLLLSLVLSLASAAADAKSDFFEAKIRPLLVAQCAPCHSGSNPPAGLRLDSREGAEKVIVPGKPESSRLMLAVSYTDKKLRMPPAAKLDDTAIENLRQWIVDGAVWPSESPREFFLSKVKPILDANCVGCHGKVNPKSPLRLDNGDGLDAQTLLEAVRYEHPRFKMPPGGKLPDESIAILAKWVQDGAVFPEVSSEPKKSTFWSFQPVRSVQPPTVSLADWNRNPIDRFILSALERKGLKPGARADKATLIRRVTYDLTGLPPTPAQTDAFVADKSPDAFAKVVDRLLASPQYGERWGRHWLDLVRYADTAGDGADFPVPEAYKYRNWVIDAFNKDKPYDQFVREQIAGDLLPSTNDEERWNQIIATGYIAISRRIGVSPHTERYITLEDTIDNFGKTFLGLSVGCARCHDHKFDPIPTRDYYGLYGIFDSSVYPFAGAEHKPHRSDFVYRVGAEKAAEILKPYKAMLDPWDKRERDKFDEYQAFQDRKITTPGRSREIVWAELLEVREERRKVAEQFPALETAYAIQDGKGHDVRIQRMGEPKMPGDVAPRGFLQVLGGQKVPAEDSGSGRRELADWVASAENPLTARVMVNRLWHYHFGRGIVATTSDFGVRGTPPANPELLDWLAAKFVQEGWSVKAMHRLILLSETYQLATTNISANAAVDPENLLHWRQNRRRLDAESISDSVRLISGSLDVTPGGRHPFPHELTYFYRQHEPFHELYPNPKRTVYGMQQRFQKNAYLDLFDGPDGNQQMAERKSTTTSLQSLFLMNSQFLHEQSAAIAERLLAGAGAGFDDRVQWAYQAGFWPVCTARGSG